jgi:hypothetical protein
MARYNIMQYVTNAVKAPHPLALGGGIVRAAVVFVFAHIRQLAQLVGIVHGLIQDLVHLRENIVNALQV